MTTGPTRPTSYTPLHLGVAESPVGHPVAAVEAYPGDVALLNYLLQDLRVVARRAAKGEVPLTPYQHLEWSVHGLARRTIICDPDALLAEADRCVVGFFGDRRIRGSDDVVDAAELDVTNEFRHHPGLVSYSSIELVGHQWANLVVHTEPDDREGWRDSAVHIAAAESLAPRIYHNVRIHNGRIPGGPLGSSTIVLESTKYWDYDVEPHWHARRDLPGGVSEGFSGATESTTGS